MKNKNNPMEIYKQITNGKTPEQMDSFYKRVEQMGFSPDVISKLKG